MQVLDPGSQTEYTGVCVEPGGGWEKVERALHAGTPPSIPRGKATVLPPFLKVYDGGFLRSTY